MEKKNLLPGTVGCAVASVCVHACAGGFGKLCGWGGGGAASASVLCWPLLPELGNESSQTPGGGAWERNRVCTQGVISWGVLGTACAWAEGCGWEEGGGS